MVPSVSSTGDICPVIFIFKVRIVTYQNVLWNVRVVKEK